LGKDEVGNFVSTNRRAGNKLMGEGIVCTAPIRFDKYSNSIIICLSGRITFFELRVN
jgi:hypothetical protein